MTEFPIVVREIGGQNRLGVEQAEGLEADVREVVTEGYNRIDIAERTDGEEVRTVVASDDLQTIADVRWDD